MVIGIDASRANHFPRGGVEWYAYNLIRQFFILDNSDKFYLYTPVKLSEDLRPSSPNFQEKVLNWPIRKFWTLGRMGMEMTFHKPDVLFIPSHTFPLIGGRKNVITWHDICYERYPENYTKWELASLKQGIRKAIKIADRIIAVSEFTKNEMIRIYDIDPRKIKVIHLGCDHRQWQPAEQGKVDSLLGKMGINNPYFIFIGRLSLKKNIIGMIRMFNRFRETYDRPFNLVLVGNDSSFKKEIDEEISSSTFKEDIIKLGWLPTADLPILLSGAAAMLFPSIYEGFGLPAVEAMSCGCPVIASNSSSLPEILGNAGLFSETHNIEGFVRQMSSLVSDLHLREELVKRGLERAKAFNWQTCALETLKVLQTV